MPGHRHGRRSGRGASSAEYAVLIALIAIIILAAVATFGGATSGLFQKSCQSVSSGIQSGSC